MEMMEDGIRIVAEGYICDGGRKTYANTNVRVEDRTMGDEIKAMVDEIIEVVISIAEKRVKSVADGIEDESSNTQVSGGRKISNNNNNRKGLVLSGVKKKKKKIDKNDEKVEVLRRKNIHRNNKGVVPCDGHCHKTFETRWNMERHFDARNLIKCEHCKKGLLGVRNYNNHLKRSHKEFLKKLRC